MPEEGRSGLGGACIATVSLSNTLNVGSRGAGSRRIDGESTTRRLNREGALSPRWHQRVSLPLIHDSGSFDQLIDGHHCAFGFSRGCRPDHARRQLDEQYQGLARIDLDAPQPSVGARASRDGLLPGRRGGAPVVGGERPGGTDRRAPRSER